MNRSKKIKTAIVYIIEETDSYQAKWLKYAMNLYGITMSELSRKVRLSRTIIQDAVRGKYWLKFYHIAAICCVLNLPDDPEEVYQNIQEDRNRNNANNDGVN